MQTNGIHRHHRPMDGSQTLISPHIDDAIASRPQKIITGWAKAIVQSRIHLSILKLITQSIQNPVKVFKIINALIQLRQNVLGDKLSKAAYVDGKYYWDLYAPGYGSEAFAGYIEGEINRITPIGKPTNRFTNVFIALTKKCALQCEHCFEWDALNGKEVLGLEDIKNIVDEFQRRGLAQIQLTGGEPLLRVQDIVEMLKGAKRQTDFWILTSGMNMGIENARKLKNAGLTGVMVSLDHFNPHQHNLFRGHPKSFEWAQSAVKNAIDVNLVTGLSICVTKTFVTESNLMAYAEVAKTWGVSFIQILEPRAVGHYKGMDVGLEKEQIELLKTFYFKLNNEKAYSNYPIVVYHGYHQRQTGCFASGNRNLYVDTDGDIHACPFCQTKTGNVLNGNLEYSLDILQTNGCHMFKNSSN